MTRGNDVTQDTSQGPLGGYGSDSDVTRTPSPTQTAVRDKNKHVNRKTKLPRKPRRKVHSNDNQENNNILSFSNLWI